MKYLLISSSQDLASLTMQEYLIEFEGFNQSKFVPFYPRYLSNIDKKTNDKDHGPRELVRIVKSNKYEDIDLLIFDHELISLTNLDRLFGEECLLIFLSKHASKSKTPTLTSHFTGNFSSDNTLGGNPFELGMTYPTFQKQYMKNLADIREDLREYDLTIEATHHGPTSSSNPLMFVEIGSTEKEWNNKFTASSICKCVLQTIVKINKNNHPKEKSKIAIGIGGNHYPRKFNELILSSEVAFASIASKYNLKYIDQEMLKQMKLKSIEQVTDVYFDKQISGAEKRRLMSLSESEGLVTNMV